jgi:hypothetical protein
MRGLVADDRPIAWARLFHQIFPTGPWQHRLAWIGLAECADRPEPFFPERTGPSGIRKARAMCSRCTVRDECRSYVEDLEVLEGPQDGIWAGLSRWERARERGRFDVMSEVDVTPEVPEVLDEPPAAPLPDLQAWSRELVTRFDAAIEALVSGADAAVDIALRGRRHAEQHHRDGSTWPELVAAARGRRENAELRSLAARIVAATDQLREETP